MALRSKRINIPYMHRDQCAFITDYYVFHKSSPSPIVTQKSRHPPSSSMLCARSLDQEKHKASVIFLYGLHTLSLLGASSVELKQTNHWN